MAERAVVTGASGFIGGVVARELEARGHRVTAVSRDPARHRAQAPQWTWMGWDDAGLDDAIADARFVVNLAGTHIFERRWGAAFKQVVVDSRVGPTQRVVAAMCRSDAPARVLVNASGVAGYGDTGDRKTPETARAATDYLGQLHLDWEQAAGRAADEGIRVVQLRIGLALGAGKGALEVLEKPLGAGVALCMGKGAQFVPWIHEHDLARLVATALEDPRYVGPINACAPEPVPFETLARTLGDIHGARRNLKLPAWFARLVIGEASDILLRSSRAVPAKALALGFEFEHGALQSALRSLYGRVPQAAAAAPAGQSAASR